jgi:hypothetical protein
MDEAILQQIFVELFEALEPLETQNAALLQLLKSKGIVNDQELAPFLEQAGNASNVRWRAARVRTAALISSAMKPADKPAEPAPAPAVQQSQAKTAESTKEEPKEEEPGKKESSRKDEPASKEAQSSENGDGDKNLGSELSDPPLFTLNKELNKEGKNKEDKNNDNAESDNETQAAEPGTHAAVPADDEEKKKEAA